MGVTDAKRRVVDRLKRVESATAGELADELGITEVAVRQHLDALVERGLVERRDGDPRGRGRPPARWALTPLAADLFPDRHGDLTIGLIESIREALGEKGLTRVIDTRTAHQLDAYRAALPDPATSSVRVRVRRLAELRSAEGYLAEALPDGDGWLLIEHHCPICDAAATCTGLCRSELEVFEGALGDDVEVTRVSHLLSGDQRCAYRVTPLT